MMGAVITPTQADIDCAHSIFGEMVLGNESRAHKVAARHRLAAESTQAAEIARLEASQLVSGKLRCAKCEFVLIKTTLNVSDGRAYSDNEPDKCLNCDVPMWRVTWKDEAEDAWKTAEAQVERAVRAEAEIARLRTRLAQFEMALTPSGETKYIHIGGYSFTQGLPDWIDEDGEEHPPAPARVPWTTTKEIMARIMKSVDGFVPREVATAEGVANG